MSSPVEDNIYSSIKNLYNKVVNSYEAVIITIFLLIIEMCTFMHYKGVGRRILNCNTYV